MGKSESSRRPARAMKTTYEKWQEGEKIPVLKAFFVEDVMKVGLEPWERTGGKGAFIDLAGSENTNGVYLCEVPPGRALKPQRHLYEEMIYVLSGRGGASVWYDEGRKQTFEWQAGSLFSPPLNAWFQLFNGSGSEPARFLAVTTVPLVMNLFHNLDFLFNLDYRFTDRFNGEEGYFTQTKEASPEGWWRTNFVSNLGTFQPSEDEGQNTSMNRGVGVQTAVFSLAESTLGAHISQWPVGTYKKAHRHGPGANIIILRGRGYSLLWPEGKARQRIDWHPGSLFVPPPQWFHQHFNSGSEPVRFVALRWGDKFYMGGVFGHEGVGTDVKEGGNQIEYEDQDPEIHRLFVEECAKSGVRLEKEEFWKKRDMSQGSSGKVQP